MKPTSPSAPTPAIAWQAVDAFQAAILRANTEGLLQVQAQLDMVVGT